MLYPQEIKNYRDWTKIDIDLWRHYWFRHGQRGVLRSALLVGRAVDHFRAAQRSGY
jgi:hypothetical protein